MVMSMKAKNIIIMALAGILLTACKDKTYKPPTLDAMRRTEACHQQLASKH
jgi:outer membrane biogenesis lipoprotein LolB